MAEKTEELKKVLLEHAARYPLMRPQDVIKLLYQSEFGTGHMIENTESAYDRLQSELEQTPHSADAPLLERIGNGFFRLNLAAAKREKVSASEIFPRFLAASSLQKGSLKALEDKLIVIFYMCAEGRFSFTLGELKMYLDSWYENGCKAVSHSEEYRAAYSPAYRVICEQLNK